MAINDTPTMSRSTSFLSLSESQDPRKKAEQDFKGLIVDISEHLNQQELNVLRYYYKRDLGAARDNLNALKILEKLEEKGIFSYQYVSPLNDLLQTVVRRIDLLPSLKSYVDKHPDIVNSGKGQSVAI